MNIFFYDLLYFGKSTLTQQSTLKAKTNDELIVAESNKVFHFISKFSHEHPFSKRDSEINGDRIATPPRGCIWALYVLKVISKTVQRASSSCQESQQLLKH